MQLLSCLVRLDGSASARKGQSLMLRAASTCASPGWTARGRKGSPVTRTTQGAPLRPLRAYGVADGDGDPSPRTGFLAISASGPCPHEAARAQSNKEPSLRTRWMGGSCSRVQRCLSP